MLSMVDPALGALQREINKRKRGAPNAVAVAAARDVLDRAGLAAPTPESIAAGVTFQLVVMPAGQMPVVNGNAQQQIEPAMVPGAPGVVLRIGGGRPTAATEDRLTSSGGNTTVPARETLSVHLKSGAVNGTDDDRAS